MLRWNTKITVTNEFGSSVSFPFVHSWQTDESIESLTNTAQIIIPRKLNQQGMNLFAGANPIFKRRDKIKIEAGLFPDLRTIFDGYITHVSANIPVRLECEDKMFLLKQINFTYPKGLTTPEQKNTPIKLSELIRLVWLSAGDLVSDCTYSIVSEIELGGFTISNANGAQVLDKLRSEYGIYSKFVGSVLRVGFAADATDTKTAEFKMEEVCINSNELEYQEAADVRVKVKATSMLRNNQKLEREVGDTDGEQRSFFAYNITDVTVLDKMANSWLEKNKYTGYQGSFETFGEPYLRHGDYAKIVSTKLPERDGNYLVKGVKRMYSVDGGYKQIFELWYKA
jgi:hypothetical protein